MKRFCYQCHREETPAHAYPCDPKHACNLIGYNQQFICTHCFTRLSTPAPIQQEVLNACHGCKQKFRTEQELNIHVQLFRCLSKSL